MLEGDEPFMPLPGQVPIDDLSALNGPVSEDPVDRLRSMIGEKQEEKSAAACLVKHKKHFKQCTNGTKKSKHCDKCGTAAVRP